VRARERGCHGDDQQVVGDPVTTTPVQMSERQLQSAVVELAEWLGWKHYHTFDSRRSNPGFPDLTLVKDNTLLFVELKSAKGRLTAEQTEWLEALGFVATVATWRPRDWLDGTVERVLRGES
jgi:hypothetical protein